MDKEPYDPLLHDVALPLTRTFYALGFRVDIATNSQQVIDAAAESWGAYPAEFPSRPVELHVIVRPGEAASGEPVVRTQRHYFSVVSDHENFGAYDSASFFGYCYVTEGTVAGRRWFRFHFLETMAYMLLAQRYVMPVHAACVANGATGVLLYGLSGAGKSTLAWACARSGWTYITDDGVWLLPDAAPGTVLGHSRQIRFKPDAPALFPELVPQTATRRPNGKLSLEVPLADFPRVHTAYRCQVGLVIALHRSAGGSARADPMDPPEIAAQLLADMPRYEEDVRAGYRRAVYALLQVPCYRLTYDNLDEAVRMLASLT